MADMENRTTDSAGGPKFFSSVFAEHPSLAAMPSAFEIPPPPLTAARIQPAPAAAPGSVRYSLASALEELLESPGTDDAVKAMCSQVQDCFRMAVFLLSQDKKSPANTPRAPKASPEVMPFAIPDILALENLGEKQGPPQKRPPLFSSLNSSLWGDGLPQVGPFDTSFQPR